MSLLHQAVVESLAPAQIPTLDYDIIMSEDGALRRIKERGSSAPVKDPVPGAAITEDPFDETEVNVDSTSVHDREPSFASEPERSEAMSDTEAERHIEEIAGSAPNVETYVEGLEPQSVIDEAFLSAKLNFANPLTFEVSGMRALEHIG